MFTSTMSIPVMLLSTSLLLYNTPKVFASSEPLLLTPYINRGDIATARQLSLVNDPNGIIPSSHAGFITAYESKLVHLFFWYFPTLSSNPKAPLLIWLNGGPGHSSMNGLFVENGPMQLLKRFDGDTAYIKRNNTWINKFNMLYIDNPVGVGYSYSERNYTRDRQENIAIDLYEFVKQFYQLFSDLLLNDLYIGGVSYAGKYVPALAKKIHLDIQGGRSNIRLKGIYLGAPLMDARVQMYQIFDLYYGLGYITIKELQDYRQNLMANLPPSNVTQFTSNFLSLMYKLTRPNVFTFEYDPGMTYVPAVMSSQNLRTLLHVGNLNFALDFGIFTSIIKEDLLVPSVGDLRALLESSYKVLIYSGDMDGIVSNRDIEAVLHSMPWFYRAVYYNTRREVWKSVDNTTVKGFYNHVYSLCRVVVRQAGHLVGYDKPDEMLEIMDKFVTNGCLS